MKDWLAFRNFLGGVAVWAGLLTGLALLSAQGVTAIIVPPPETTAEEFIRALKAHRYEGALKELSRELQTQVTAQDLHDLVETLEQAGQRIDGAHSTVSQPQAGMTVVFVNVRTEAGDEQPLSFLMVIEHGQWKVASLQALYDWRSP